MGWQPAVVEGAFSCAIEMSHGIPLAHQRHSGGVLRGRHPGRDDAPPDFTSATDEEVRAGMAQWTSDFEVVHATFTGG